MIFVLSYCVVIFVSYKRCKYNYIFEGICVIMAESNMRMQERINTSSDSRLRTKYQPTAGVD